MMLFRINRFLHPFLLVATLLIVATIGCSSVPDVGGEQPKIKVCPAIDVRCANTVSFAVAAEGRIWFAWVVDSHLYVNFSDDRGLSLSEPIQVNVDPESIAARGENRPKIAVDNDGNVYLSWVRKLERKWTSDLRFAWSDNGGEHFSSPITVNNDKEITSHSFNEMVVSGAGDVSVVWLDGRHALNAKIKGQDFSGSSIYMSQFTPSHQPINSPTNMKVLDGSCVCCRLALTLVPDGAPMLMWRHIFGDNYRDHALTVLGSGVDKNGVDKNGLHRVSFENWKIDGCPHHGPSIVNQAHDGKNRLHMSWFNDAVDASGLFYAYTDNQGLTTSGPFNFATKGKLPGHPNIAIASGGAVQLVWQEFNGTEKIVKMMQSRHGVHWETAKELDRFAGKVDYPYIVPHPDGSLLLWHKPGFELTLQEIE